MLALNRQVTPACPTSRAQWRSGCVAASPRRGRTSGRDLTVEGELEFETPTYKPPKAGTLYLFRLQKSCTTSCQASRPCSQRRPVPVSRLRAKVPQIRAKQ